MDDYKLKVSITGDSSALKSAVSDAEKAVGDLEKSVSNKVGSVGESMQSVGKKMTVGVTLPLAAAGAASVKTASDFETSMAKLATIADTTAVPINELESQIMALSSQTGIAASELAEASYAAISAGQNTEDAVGFVENAAKLAKAGFTDTAAAMDVLTTTINAYHMEASDAAEISDKLITAQNLGKTTVDELASSMGKVIPTANMYGVSLDNLTSAYVATTKNGIATAESTTYINGMLNELGQSGTTVAGIIKSKTGKSFKELMESGASLTDVLSIIQEDCDATGLSIGDVFGSQEAAKAAAVLVQDAESFDAAMVAMGESAGATQKAFETMDATSAEQMQKALNNLKNDAIVLGGAILSIIEPAFTAVTGVIQKASAAFQGLSPSMQKVVAGIGMVVAAIGPALIVGGKLMAWVPAVQGKLSGIVGVAKKMGTVVTGAFSSISLPVLAVAGAIAALVAAFVYLWNTNEEFRDSVMAIWEQIKEAVMPVIEQIKEALANMWEAFKPILDQIINILTTYIIPFLGKIITVVGEIAATVISVIGPIVSFIVGVIADIIGAISPIVSFIGGVLGTVFDIWQGIFKRVWQLVSGVINAIGSVIKGLISVVGPVFSTIGDIIGAVFSGIKWAWDGLSPFVSGIVDGISTAFDCLVDTVKALINGVIWAINGAIWVINLIPGVEIDEIPYLAHGTDDFAGGFAYINEGGRGELVNLPNGSQVIPHDVSMAYARESARMNNGGGAVSLEGIMDGLVIQVNNAMTVDGTPLREMAAEYTIKQIGTQQRALRRAGGYI